MEENEINQNLNLNQLTDQQKTWLTQISYLDINEEGRDKISKDGLTAAELKDYLDKQDDPYFGTAGVGKRIFNSAADRLTGEESALSMTNEELLDKIIENGMGDLKITDISERQYFYSSGFQAMAFQDSNGNTGISYRGSDADLSKGGARDWLESDVLEYFTGKSTQQKQAMDFFDKNKNVDGNNYVYGHSLGGNLTSRVYVDHHKEIKEAFTINGTPINQKTLDTQEKIDAFNDPNKYHCNVISGDIIGHLKSCEKYQDNVNYIRNNGEMKDNALSAHLVQSAEYDENGKFATMSKQEMIQEMGSSKKLFVEFAQNVREYMNEIGDKLDGFKSEVKHMFGDYKEEINSFFEKQNIEIFHGKENEKILNQEIGIKSNSELNMDIDIEELFDIDLDGIGDICNKEEAIDIINKGFENIDIEDYLMNPEMSDDLDIYRR